MLKLEVEEEDGGDPSIHGRVGLNIWVVDHAFNVLSVDFDG